jgi:hypothetical protein
MGEVYRARDTKLDPATSQRALPDPVEELVVLGRWDDSLDSGRKACHMSENSELSMWRSQHEGAWAIRVCVRMLIAAAVSFLYVTQFSVLLNREGGFLPGRIGIAVAFVETMLLITATIGPIVAFVLFFLSTSKIKRFRIQREKLRDLETRIRAELPQGSGDYATVLALSMLYRQDGGPRPTDNLLFPQLESAIAGMKLPHPQGDDSLRQPSDKSRPEALVDLPMMPKDWAGTWGEVTMVYRLGVLTEGEHGDLHRRAHPDSCAHTPRPSKPEEFAARARDQLELDERFRTSQLARRRTNQLGGEDDQ